MGLVGEASIVLATLSVGQLSVGCNGCGSEIRGSVLSLHSISATFLRFLVGEVSTSGVYIDECRFSADTYYPTAQIIGMWTDTRLEVHDTVFNNTSYRNALEISVRGPVWLLLGDSVMQSNEQCKN